jgi:hypothetical protein
VERLPTVLATCRQRGRDVRDFLAACLRAGLDGTTATPSTAVNGYSASMPAGRASRRLLSTTASQAWQILKLSITVDQSTVAS